MNPTNENEVLDPMTNKEEPYPIHDVPIDTQVYDTIMTVQQDRGNGSSSGISSGSPKEEMQPETTLAARFHNLSAST